MTDDIDTTDAPGALAAALSAMQIELPKIEKSETAKVETKGGGSYSYTYAGLATISEHIMPLLGKYGLAFIAKPAFVGDRFVLAYSLLHTSGEREDGQYPLPSSGTPQAIGSAITYGRRYCLCAVTGVAPEDDDDGAAAEAEKSASRGTAQRATTPRRQQQPRGKTAQRTSAAPPPPLPDEDTPQGISDGQSKRMHALFNDLGMTDRDERIAYTNKGLDREISSSSELTSDEATKLINHLQDRLEKPFGDGEDSEGRGRDPAARNDRVGGDPDD